MASEATGGDDNTALILGRRVIQYLLGWAGQMFFRKPNKRAAYPGEGKPSVLLVDPLAAERGHLLQDDLFFSECILPLTKELLVATSSASAANLRERLSVRTWETPPVVPKARFPRFRLIRLLLSLPCSHFDHVVFLSYEEISTLLFMLLNPGRRVHLFVHNNLRPDRIKRHPILGRLFLRATFKRAASVIVHCQHQVDRIRELLPNLDPGRICVEPYHLFGVNRVRLALEEKSRKVLFVGPVQAHKKLEPVLELIRRDTDHRYHYHFCAMGQLPPEVQDFLESQPNVEISYGYLSDEDYYRFISDAAMVILTHDEDFEGTVSGILCDAVASGTAVIARDMAPQSEFFARFGQMGFLVDYDDPKWHSSVLDADLAEKYGAFQENMGAFRTWCGIESIRSVYDALFKRASMH